MLATNATGIEKAIPNNSIKSATNKHSPLHSWRSLTSGRGFSCYRLSLLKSPYTRDERTKNDGEHTIHSNDDLRHSAHCLSLRPGPDDPMGWTYLESHQRWYGRRRFPGSSQSRIQPGTISTSPDVPHLT